MRDPVTVTRRQRLASQRARETRMMRRLNTRTDTPDWSAVPMIARVITQENPDLAIEVVFPTVYEEDRSTKIKDLITSNAFGAITHQRACEQIAKELGYEDYVYTDELAAIEKELKTLPPAILGAGDAIAGAVKGAGGKGGGGISIGAPAAGLASEDEEDIGAIGRRMGNLSGDVVHAWKHQQRR